MIIIKLIPFILFVAAGLLCWAICASIPPDPEEDEEQERYLEEWERKHGK